MTNPFFTVLTRAGEAKLAKAMATSSKVIFTHMAVGDSNGTLSPPDPTQTQLINQHYFAPITQLSVDPKNSNQLIAELIIPAEEGGYWIREIGLFDEDNLLIAIANCPESYKPKLQEGSGRTQGIRMVLAVASTHAVTLKIDDTQVLASRQYVDDKVAEHEKTRRHPIASLTATGLVQLSSETESNDESVAATPKAIHIVKQEAETRVKKSGDRLTGELISNSPNNYRIIANDRAFFLRFDGSHFYILKTASGEVNGQWDESRPLSINAETGEVHIGTVLSTSNNFYIEWGGRGHRYQENGDIVEMLGTASIFRSYGETTSLSGALLHIANTASSAWNKANDAQITRVIDIRLGPVELTAAWNANGYDDAPPYVLTGASNFNKDQYIDTVYRRPLQKNINGTWYNISWI